IADDRARRPPYALQVASDFAWDLTVAAILAVVVLMLVRFILNYADMNPFSRPVILVRRLTDPYVNPVRRALMGFGVQPNGAPLLVPLRQMIPPLGMFDISPIVAIIIIWLFQTAIAVTLLRGWQPNFF